MAPTESLRKFIIQNICDAANTLNLKNEENIFEAGYVDSTFAMELIIFIEKQFNIQIPDEDLDLENFSSIDRMVQYIDRKKGQEVSS